MLFSAETAKLYGGNFCIQALEEEDEDAPGVFVCYILMNEKIINHLETWMQSRDGQKHEEETPNKDFTQHEIEDTEDESQSSVDEHEIITSLQTLTMEVRMLQDVQQNIKDEILQSQRDIFQQGMKSSNQVESVSDDLQHERRRRGRRRRRKVEDTMEDISKHKMKNRLCYRCRRKGHEARNCMTDANGESVLSSMAREKPLKPTNMKLHHFGCMFLLMITLYLLCLYFHTDSISAQFQDKG